MNDYEKMAAAFEIEELEERVEFAKWTAKATVESGPGGTTVGGEVGVEF